MAKTHELRRGFHADHHLKGRLGDLHNAEAAPPIAVAPGHELDQIPGDKTGCVNGPPSALQTVDEVLEALDTVIAKSLQNGSRVGYFAAIYRKVTAKVAEGITSGFFDDGERMQRLDVAFAMRYLTALDLHERGSTPTRSWQRTFAATAASRPIVLQHLLLGINAHINLDLGIASAETAPGAALPGLRRDFDRINEILAVLMSGIERSLSEISPWIGLLGRIGGRHDDEVVRFSIEVARTEAWRFATELAPLPPPRLGRPDWHPRCPGSTPGQGRAQSGVADCRATRDSGPCKQ